MAPRRIWQDGMELLDTDLSVGSAALELELYDRVLYQMMNRQQNVVFGDSLISSYVNATTSQVLKGLGMYYDNTQVDPEPMTRQIFVAGNSNVTHTAADGSHNRIDVIYATPARANTATATRNQKDPGSGVVSPVTLSVESDWAPTLGVVAGTPGVSPAVPSTPAGSIALAQVLVTAVSGIAGAGAYTDVRPRYFRNKATIKTVTAAYTVDLDDEVILGNATGGAFAITLPPVASCAGKNYKFKKTDSSANAVTLTGNSSDLMDGSNTQALSAQDMSLVLHCDGSSWFIF